MPSSKKPRGGGAPETPAWMQLAGAVVIFAWAVSPTVLRVLATGVVLGLLVKLFTDNPVHRAPVKRLIAKLAHRYEAFLALRLAEARRLTRHL